MNADSEMKQTSREDTLPLTRLDEESSSSTRAVVPAIISLSIFSSVCLVLINKQLLQFYKFEFVCTLTALHFLSGYISLSVASSQFHVFDIKYLPSKESWLVGGMGVASIVFMNLSLQLNSVGTYQLLKLLCIPCVMLIQVYLYQSSFSRPIKASLAMLLLGVGVATVTDVQFSSAGLIAGAGAVLSTSVFNIWQGSKQKEHGVSSTQLLHAISFQQFAITGLLALILETSGKHTIFNHTYSATEILLIGASCALAVSVNLCSMGLIGKTSAITYQVVGHAKTCLILLFGFILYTQTAPTAVLAKNIGGVLIALVGVFAYSYFKLKE